MITRRAGHRVLKDYQFLISIAFGALVGGLIGQVLFPMISLHSPHPLVVNLLSLLISLITVLAFIAVRGFCVICKPRKLRLNISAVVFLLAMIICLATSFQAYSVSVLLLVVAAIFCVTGLFTVSEGIHNRVKK